MDNNPSKLNVWLVITDLKRSAAYNGLYYDWKAAGYIILSRAQKYLEHGELVHPGFSTRDFEVK